MINSRNYSWSEVFIRIAGMLSLSIEGVRFEWRQEKEFVYGAGNNPHDIKSGNAEGRGDLTLQQSDYERLLDIIPTGKITDLPPFNIEVAFVNEFGKMVNYSLIFCAFEGAELALNQNDKLARITLPFMYLQQKRTPN